MHEICPNLTNNVFLLLKIQAFLRHKKILVGREKCLQGEQKCKSNIIFQNVLYCPKVPKISKKKYFSVPLKYLGTVCSI
jgi:hypothetical protein